MKTIVVVSLLLLTPLAHAEGIPYETLVAQARAAAAQGAYAEAVRVLEEAYALRQEPELLLSLARGHRKLGHARETIDYYTRYRLAAGTTTTEVADEIDGALRLATAPVVSSEPRVRYVERPHNGYRIAGSVLFATAYSAAAITGGAFTAYGNNDTYGGYGDSRVAGGMLFIPFLGPFISSGVYRNPAWVGPWVAIDGGMQLIGLALMIASTKLTQRVPVNVAAARARREALVPMVSPYTTRDGVGATVAWRF